MRDRRLVASLMLGLAVILCACSSGPKSAASTTTPTPTAVTGKKITGPFFGFNGASIIRNVNIDLLMSQDLQRKLAAFPARLIRVPTGTAAQWIDWRTGEFIDDPTSPFASIGPDRHPVTMHDWATLIERTHATPVWDLNVLTSTLDDQIAMLNEAEKLGMPVRYIELGNEIWDARSIYPKIYPTGTAYAKAMNSWIPSLRKHFPDASIAVSGADPSDEFFASVFGKRFATWNDEVLATIRGADAIAIHPYWTLPGRAAPGSSVDATLRAGTDAWHRFESRTLAAVPRSMTVWLTEWNQAAWASKDGTQIWAQALSVAAVAIAQLTDPHISMSLIHNIVDGVTNPQDVGTSITFPVFTDGAKGSEPLQPTALGIALLMLFGAVAPGVRVETISAPAFVDGVAIVGTHPSAIYVNRRATTVTVHLPKNMAGSWRSASVRAAPDAQPGWVATDRVERTSTTVTATVSLPPYSITSVSRSRS